MAVRFTRKDLSDGATEILTLVQIDGEPKTKYRVEVCSGPNVGDDFVGLYDLDGEQIQLGNCEWAAVDSAPPEVVQAVAEDWAHGSTVVERMA